MKRPECCKRLSGALPRDIERVGLTFVAEINAAPADQFAQRVSFDRQFLGRPALQVCHCCLERAEFDSVHRNAQRSGKLAATGRHQHAKGGEHTAPGGHQSLMHAHRLCQSTDVKPTRATKTGQHKIRRIITPVNRDLPDCFSHVLIGNTDNAGSRFFNGQRNFLRQSPDRISGLRHAERKTSCESCAGNKPAQHQIRVRDSGVTPA